MSQQRESRPPRLSLRSSHSSFAVQKCLSWRLQFQPNCFYIKAAMLESVKTDAGPGTASAGHAPCYHAKWPCRHLPESRILLDQVSSKVQSAFPQAWRCVEGGESVHTGVWRRSGTQKGARCLLGTYTLQLPLGICLQRTCLTDTVSVNMRNY